MKYKDIFTSPWFYVMVFLDFVYVCIFKVGINKETYMYLVPAEYLGMALGSFAFVWIGVSILWLLYKSFLWIIKEPIKT